MILDGVFAELAVKVDEEVRRNRTPELEMEVRYSKTTKRNYYRVLSDLRKQMNSQLIETTDYIVDGKRYTVTHGLGGSGMSAMTKNVIKSWKINEYGVKVSISSEIDEKVDKEKVDLGKASLIRSKSRNRFTLGSVYIDMTVVTSSSAGRKAVDTHEIELELIPPYTEARLEEMSKAVDQMAKIILNSEILYDQALKLSVVREYNRILAKEHQQGLQKLSLEPLANARNLKRKDCVWGGLLRGEKGPSRYTITLKAEGVRHILFFHTSGIWLLSPPETLNFISKAWLKELEGTLIDGEVITQSAMKNGGMNTKYMYIPIDMMAYKGDSSVQTQDFLQRSALRDRISVWFQSINTPQFLELIPKSRFQIHTKEFKLLEGDSNVEPNVKVDCLNAAVTDMVNADDKALFKTDGWILTPVEAPYNTNTLPSAQLKNRTLTVHPDICKLKRWKDLTIDFLYQIGSDGKKLLYVNTSSGFQPFEGHHFSPFDQSTQVDWNNPMLSSKMTKTVIEFGPQKVNGKIVMVPVRPRLDKSEPNPKRIASDVWVDINRPFEVESLQGLTLDLAFQSHTNFKREFLKGIPVGAHVIDLGAGAGGDIAKLLQASKVLAVEPNPENSAEYQRRVFLNKVDSRFKVITTTAQDTNTIIDEATSFFRWRETANPPPLYVLSMFSLSFFWKDQRTLQSLARTLQAIRRAYPSKEKVRFLFATIEGERTVNAVNKLGTSSPNHPEGGVKEFTLGQAEFKFTPPNVLDLHIEGTIVKNQREYLVDLQQLIDLTLDNVNTSPINLERFLSKIEREYNSMYIYGRGYIVDKGQSFPPYDPNIDGPSLRSQTPIPVVQTPIPEAPEQKELLLPALPVKVKARFGMSNLPYEGDDVTQELPTNLPHSGLPPTAKIVRVATMHRQEDGSPQDRSWRVGSSFLHSVLKATRKEYNLASGARRQSMVDDLTRRIASILLRVSPIDPQTALSYYGGRDPRKPDSRYPINIYFYTLEKGDLYRRINKLKPSDEPPVFLTQLLISNQDLPFQYYQYISELLGIQIKIYSISDGQLSLVHVSTTPTPNPRKIAILETSSGTYEPLAYSVGNSPLQYSFP